MFTCNIYLHTIYNTYIYYIQSWHLHELRIIMYYRAPPGVLHATHPRGRTPRSARPPAPAPCSQSALSRLLLSACISVVYCTVLRYNMYVLYTVLHVHVLRITQYLHAMHRTYM
jgi:hypothetical protein